MTNSSPPEQKSDSQKPLGLEEWIAIIVALGTIGIIFLWAIGSKEPGLKLVGTKGLSSAKELSRTPAVEQLPTDETSKYGITSKNGIDSKSFAEIDFAGEAEESQQTSELPESENLESSPNLTAFPEAIGTLSVGMLRDRASISSPGVPVDAIANGDTDGPTSVKSSRSVAGEGTPETATPADSPEAAGPASAKSSGSVAGEGTPETGTPADSPEAAGSSTDGRDGAKVASSQSMEFSDITDKYWGKEFIDRLGTANVLSGFPDGTFKPERSITRAEFATYLDGVFDNQVEDKGIKYKDVGNNEPAESAIYLATNIGAMNGYPDGNFYPNNSMSRMEVLIALVTGLNLSAPPNIDEVLEVYKDRDRIPGWAKGKIAAATASGLVVNHPNPDTLNPIEPASRAEAAAMLHQALVFRGVLKPVDSQYVVTLDE